MPRRSPPVHAGLTVLALFLGLAVTAGGCRSEERRLEELRARYRVEVAGFVVDQRPVAAPPVSGGAAGTLEPEGAAPPELAQDVRVDLLIQPADGAAAGGGDEERLSLPVELTLTGPGGAVRGRWPAVLEMAAPAAGDEPVRASYHLTAVPYQPGDRFTAAIAASSAGPAGAAGAEKAGEDAGRP